MGVFNFLTKKNNSKKPMSENNVKSQAAQKAYWQVKSEFGRAPQARTANFLKTPGQFKKTNAAAIRMQELTDKFAADMGKELKQFGTKDQVKGALQNVITQLESGVATAAGGGRGGAEGVTITIPKMVAKLLIGLLKVILFSIGILFTIALAIAGANGNLGPTETIGAFAMADAISGSTGNNNNNSVKVKEWGKGGKRRTRRNKLD
jgi:hypothetical protein